MIPSSDWCECNSASEDTFSYTVIYSKFQGLNLINSITLIVSAYNLIYEINNQDLFLYGHRNISSEDNMKIILSTIKYIMETGRFAAPPPSLLTQFTLLLLLPLPFSVLFVSCLYCTYYFMCCACRF